MTKKRDDQTISIFEHLTRMQEQARQQTCVSTGSCAIDAELRAAIFQDLKHATNQSGRELSRYEIAARMSELAGEEITYSMLCNWAADSHDHHNMPAKYMSAFILVTGGRRAIDVISKHAGIFTLPGPDALRAEIRRIDEDINRKQQEKKKRELLLEEVIKK